MTSHTPHIHMTSHTHHMHMTSHTHHMCMTSRTLHIRMTSHTPYMHLTPHTHAHSPCPQVQQGQPPANWSLPLHAMVRPNNIVGLASLQQQESPMTKVPYW